MACVSCAKNSTIKQSSEDTNIWFSREDVKKICPKCYDNMVSNNLSKIRRDVLIGKLNGETKMKLYEITYVGPENTKFNFGGHTLEPNSPKYFTVEELPFSIKQISAMELVSYSLVELDRKPTDVEASMVSAAIRGKLGVVWIGKSSRRSNDFGTFVKNEPRFDLPLEVVEKLRVTPGFKVLE